MSKKSSEKIPKADQAGPSGLQKKKQEPEADDNKKPFFYVQDKRLAGKWNKAQREYFLQPHVRDKKRNLIYQKGKQLLFLHFFSPHLIDDKLTKADWIEIAMKNQPKVMMNRVNLVVKHEHSWAKLVAKKPTFDELPPEEKKKCYKYMMKAGARTANKLDFSRMKHERNYSLIKTIEDYILYRHEKRREAELIRLGQRIDVESPADTSEARMNADQSNASDINEEEDDQMDESNNNQIQMHEAIPNVARYEFESESTEPPQSENNENGSENLSDNTFFQSSRNFVEEMFTDFFGFYYSDSEADDSEESEIRRLSGGRYEDNE